MDCQSAALSDNNLLSRLVSVDADERRLEEHGAGRLGRDAVRPLARVGPVVGVRAEPVGAMGLFLSVFDRLDKPHATLFDDFGLHRGRHDLVRERRDVLRNRQKRIARSNFIRGRDVNKRAVFNLKPAD